MRRTFLLSLFALGLAGCGDHGVPIPPPDLAVSEDMSVPIDMSGFIPDDAKHIVTFTMFAQEFAQAICAHYMACGQLDAAQMPACIERNLRHTGWDQDVEIMKGRMQINELQCLAALSAARCDNSDSVVWGAKCIEFLYEPKQALGATCLASAECMSGFCQHGGSDAGVPEQVTGCPGVCANPKPTNAPCRINSDCASDSICTGAPPTCVKRAALNEACLSPFSPSADFTKQVCQFGLSCPTYPTTPPSKCVVPVEQTALHGDCDPFQGAVAPTAPCAAPMYCQVQYSAGVACTGAPTDCQSTGGFCDTGAGVCRNPSGGKCEMKLMAGAQCDPHNEGFFSFVDNQCADGTQCYKLAAQTVPICQAFGGANADCVKNGSVSTCKVGFNCNASLKCTPWATDGQSCASSLQCPSFLPGQSVCIADNADAGANTTCQAAKNFGVTCTPGFEDSLCAPSDNANTTWCAPSGSSGTCAPRCY